MCKNGRIWRWVDHTVGYSTLISCYFKLLFILEVPSFCNKSSCRRYGPLNCITYTCRISIMTFYILCRYYIHNLFRLYIYIASRLYHIMSIQLVKVANKFHLIRNIRILAVIASVLFSNNALFTKPRQYHTDGGPDSEQAGWGVFAVSRVESRPAN